MGVYRFLLIELLCTQDTSPATIMTNERSGNFFIFLSHKWHGRLCGPVGAHGRMR